MLTPADIRRRHGLNDSLYPTRSAAASSQHVLLAEQLETRGVYKFFRQMDRFHHQRAGWDAFSACLRENNIPIYQREAAALFSRYSKSGQLTLYSLKYMVFDARPVCQRQVMEQLAENLYTHSDLPSTSQKPESTDDELLTLARTELARRCAERFHSRGQMLDQMYAHDSTITRESLGQFVAQILPDMQQAANLLVQRIVDYNKYVSAFSVPRIPIAREESRTVVGGDNYLYESAICNFLDPYDVQPLCYRREQEVLQDQLFNSAKTKDEEQTAIKTSIEQTVCAEPQISASVALSAITEYAVQVEKPLEALKQSACKSIDCVTDEFYRGGVFQKYQNRARQEASQFDFAFYGQQKQERSHSVATNPRISLQKLQKRHNDEVLNALSRERYPCACPDYKRAFDGYKMRAAAALLHAQQNSKTVAEFERALHYFAPNVGAATLRILSAYAHDQARLTALTGLTDEVRMIYQTDLLIDAEARRFVRNQSRLSEKCPCIPLCAQVADDGGLSYHQRYQTTSADRALVSKPQNKANTSSAVHGVFGTAIGDGSGATKQLMEQFSTLRPTHEPRNDLYYALAEPNGTVLRYDDVFPPSALDRFAYRSRSVAGTRSRIQSGVSDVDEASARRASRANISHDFFTYYPDFVPRRGQSKANASVVGELLREGGAGQ